MVGLQHERLRVALTDFRTMAKLSLRNTLAERPAMSEADMAAS